MTTFFFFNKSKKGAKTIKITKANTIKLSNLLSTIMSLKTGFNQSKGKKHEVHKEQPHTQHI